jgi:hypothetical protein
MEYSFLKYKFFTASNPKKRNKENKKDNKIFTQKKGEEEDGNYK